MNISCLAWLKYYFCIKDFINHSSFLFCKKYHFHVCRYKFAIKNCLETAIDLKSLASQKPVQQSITDNDFSSNFFSTTKEKKGIVKT